MGRLTPQGYAIELEFLADGVKKNLHLFSWFSSYRLWYTMAKVFDGLDRRRQSFIDLTRSSAG